MSIPKLLLCTYCGERKPDLTKEHAENYFLYCSQKCKDTQEAERLSRRLAEMEMHDPAIRHVKTAGEMRAMGLAGQSKSSNEPTNTEPKASTPHKKNGRKCGKCGEFGHNARTCGQKVRRVPEAKTSDNAPKPIASRPKAASKKRQNTCKKCGKKGHNSRTCKG